jgi:hypothetical protein
MEMDSNSATTANNSARTGAEASFRLPLTETEALFQNFGSGLTEAKTSLGFSVAGFPAKFQIFCRIFA